MTHESLGWVAEGTLRKVDGKWMITTPDKEVPLLEALEAWEGRNIRILIANLDLIQRAVQLGMQPGSEQKFVQSLDEDQVQELLD